MDWYGRREWELVMTCRRDRFSSKLDNKYLLSTREVVNKVNKVAKFNNPTVGYATFERVHVSFQCPGICNISTVNALDSVHAYVRPKERGRGIDKRR